MAIATNKILTSDKTFTGERAKNNTYLLHQTVERLPCLTCSVNISFIKTKGGICI